MADWATRLGVAHKVWIQHAYCYGDDHTNFQEAGFPAISPMDCVEAHNLATGETTPHYHQTSDRTETLYLPFTARVAGVIVATFAALGEPR
jgi:transposase